MHGNDDKGSPGGGPVVTVPAEPIVPMQTEQQQQRQEPAGEVEDEADEEAEEVFHEASDSILQDPQQPSPVEKQPPQPRQQEQHQPEEQRHHQQPQQERKINEVVNPGQGHDEARSAPAPTAAQPANLNWDAVADPAPAPAGSASAPTVPKPRTPVPSANPPVVANPANHQAVDAESATAGGPSSVKPAEGAAAEQLPASAGTAPVCLLFIIFFSLLFFSHRLTINIRIGRSWFLVRRDRDR